MRFFFIQFKEESLKSSLYTARLDKKQTIVSFLNDLDLNPKFSKDLGFLITSYILCLFCERDSDGIPNAINFELGKDTYQTSNTHIRRIIHHLQEINAGLSCEHICKLTKKLYTHDLSQWLNFQKLVGDLGRKAFPCYILTKTILDDMLAKHEKILFIIGNKHKQQIELLYQAKANKFLLLNTKEKFKCNVMVFKGITNMDLTDPTLIKQKIREFDPYQIVLANMAKHPQFTGEKLNYLRNCPFHCLPASQNPEITEYMNYFQHMHCLAESIGACEDVVGLFYIKHIFSIQNRTKPQNQALNFQEETVYA